MGLHSAILLRNGSGFSHSVDELMHVSKLIIEKDLYKYMMDMPVNLHGLGIYFQGKFSCDWVMSETKLNEKFADIYYTEDNGAEDLFIYQEDFRKK